MLLKRFLIIILVALAFSPHVFAEDPSPLGNWGYFIQDEYDDSIWSLAMKITESQTQIAVHCEWNGQVDDSELSVESVVSGDQLIFASDASAKGQQGCDFNVYAGATKFKVTNSSLIFLDEQGSPILVFYRKK